MSRFAVVSVAVALVLSPIVAHAGSISGTVVTDRDGTPIAGADIRVANALGQSTRFASTDATGAYVVEDLPADTYFMFVEASGFVSERYDDISCLEGCPAGSGTPIPVAAEAEITGIDTALTRFGEVAGRVTDAATGEPLTDARVELYGVDGTFGNRSVRVASDGSYRLTELRPGDYTIAADSPGHRGELYDGLPCEGGFFFGCQPEDGTRVQVMLESVTGIDFGLDRLGAITGRVTAEATAEPLALVDVTAWTIDGTNIATVNTDADGRYAISLPPGEYTLSTDTVGRFVDELWDDRVCYRGACDRTTGDRVEVGLSTTTEGIDFALANGGEITGRVRAAGSGLPVSGAIITVFDADGVSVSSTVTESDGRYSVPALNTGTYTAWASAGFQAQYETQLYDHMRCPAGCDPRDGTPIEVDISGTTGGVDFDLEELGQIAGTIRDASTGDGIPFAMIHVFLPGGGVWGELPADENGDYRIQGLTDGEYFVVGAADGFLSTLYPAVPCPGEVCDLAAGQPITAALGTVVSGIDITLPTAGAVSGTVRTSSGDPIASAEVSVYDTLGDRLARAFTDSDGGYRFLGLATGDVYVVAAAGAYSTEVWNDTPCAVDCDPTTGDPIRVELGRETSGIDFTLERLATISGTVLDADSLLPPDFALVRVWTPEGLLASESLVSAAPDGRWISESLLPGRYFVTTRASGYRDQAWASIPCDEPCDPTRGTPIDVVNDSEVTGIDFQVRLARGLVGRVTGTDSPVGVAGITLGAWRLPGLLFEGSTTTGPEGGYSLGLGIGDYVVGTRNGRGAVDELWDDIACPDGSPLDDLCDPSLGDPVTVTENELTTGIDFALDGLEPACSENDRTLCLAGGRYRVQASWRDGAGGFGAGRVRPITDDTGYFWFFEPDNVEVVVKVLDACVAPFDRFWVFAAGLTDVEVTLTVTDVRTNETRAYVNPVATPFQPILDTDAFATCDASKAAPRPTPPSASTVFEELAEVLGPDHADTPCGTGEHLCLNRGRFRVEATWRSADGSGTASAVPLTGDTGYFWFFGPDNVEVVVKVLDACVAPFERFWVFAAGLTDVEIELTVTDQLSGESRIYPNTLGQPFQPILDTDAFATCSL